MVSMRILRRYCVLGGIFPWIFLAPTSSRLEFHSTHAGFKQPRGLLGETGDLPLALLLVKKMKLWIWICSIYSQEHWWLLPTQQPTTLLQNLSPLAIPLVPFLNLVLDDQMTSLLKNQVGLVRRPFNRLYGTSALRSPPLSKRTFQVQSLFLCVFLSKSHT